MREVRSGRRQEFLPSDAMAVYAFGVSLPSFNFPLQGQGEGTERKGLHLSI